MLGGVAVFGVFGIVLGPVTFATAAAIIDTLRSTRADLPNPAQTISSRPDVV